MSTPSVAAKYAMSWLLDFVQADLHKLSNEEKIRVQKDLYNFQPDAVGVSGFSRVAPLHYSKKYNPGMEPEYEGETPMEKWTTVRQRHAELRAAIDAMNKGAWTFEHRLRQTLTGTSRQYSGSDHDMFFARVADVLGSAWRLTQPCGNCGTRFLPEGKQKFCSPQCRNKANWTNFQKKHPNRKRNYRAEYLARVKRTKGES